VGRAHRATGLLAFVDRFLQRLPRVRGSCDAGEVPVRRQGPALFVERCPQNARLTTLGANVHGFLLGAGPVGLAPRPSGSHVLVAVSDRAPVFGGGGGLGGAELASGIEQTDASTAHFLPPARSHSASARCPALNFALTADQILRWSRSEPPEDCEITV
jgi:hypothetical protein